MEVGYEGPLPLYRWGGFTLEPYHHQGLIRVNMMTPQLEVFFLLFFLFFNYFVTVFAAVLCSLWGVTYDKSFVTCNNLGWYLLLILS